MLSMVKSHCSRGRKSQESPLSFILPSAVSTQTPAAWLRGWNHGFQIISLNFSSCSHWKLCPTLTQRLSFQLLRLEKANRASLCHISHDFIPPATCSRTTTQSPTLPFREEEPSTQSFALRTVLVPKKLSKGFGLLKAQPTFLAWSRPVIWQVHVTLVSLTTVWEQHGWH